LRAQFQVYRHVHLPDVYNSLREAWASYYQASLNSNDYFPAYRAKVQLESNQSS
jgi:hypothetical protein